jgi:hypothetical protein
LFSALGISLVRAGHMPPPDPGDPGPFSLDDPERVRGLLEGAGFAPFRTGTGYELAGVTVVTVAA